MLLSLFLVEMVMNQVEPNFKFKLPYPATVRIPGLALWHDLQNASIILNLLSSGAYENLDKRPLVRP